MNQIGEFSFSMTNILPIGWQVMTNLYVIAGLICYVISVIVWLLVLSRMEVSIAYPMVSIGYIVNAFAAYYLFAEDLTLTKVLGIGIIIIGVFLVART